MVEKWNNGLEKLHIIAANPVISDLIGKTRFSRLKQL
jgi:hypothetical protein